MYRVDGAVTVIGRSVTAGVRIIDDDVRVSVNTPSSARGGKVKIEDLESVNGTLVNGEPVRRASGRALTHGDKITIGSTTILKFTYADNLDESFQRQMFDAAQRDGLTRAFNKRYFLERIGAEIAFASVASSHAALAAPLGHRSLQGH